MKMLRFASCLIVVLAAVAQGAPIAYDGVAYPAGGLNGRGPALGFGPPPWAADAGVNVVAAGLSSGLDLPSTGGGVVGSFNFIDPLLNPIAPAPGKEFWASFLINHGAAPNDQSFMGLSPAGAALGSVASVAIGIQLGHYGIFNAGAFTPSPTPPFTAAGTTDFMVAHFKAIGAAWQVSLFINPGSLSVPNLVVNVNALTYQTMVNQIQTGYETDEYRLGDTAADVAAGAVPTVGTTWGRLKALYH